MIYKLDDTMTQEEENLCQRANNLRRRSEVTFKTVDATKYDLKFMNFSSLVNFALFRKLAARRVHSYGDPESMPQFEQKPL